MPRTLQPVRLEVLAHIPTDFFHCSHCERLFDIAGVGASVHREMQTAYPLDMLEETERLAAWLQDLSTRYGEQLHIRVVDPQSPQGFAKSLIYRTGHYPTFVINRRTKYAGWEPAALDRLLDEEIARRAPNDGGLQTRTPAWERVWHGICHVTHVLREILYGLTTFEWARDMQRERGEVERLFVLITFGDLVGLPILPPYYTLRLLPYVVPAINRWKRGLLRERDWTDLAGLIEGVD